MKNVKTISYDSLIVGQPGQTPPPLTPGTLVVENNAVIGEIPSNPNNIDRSIALQVVGKVKAESFEGNGIGAFPRGGIIVWSGSIEEIPTNWALCDGNNGTPNLTDRFLVGAGNQYTVGDTGGQDQVQLTIDQMPSHNHGGGYHAHSIEGRFPLHESLDPQGAFLKAERFSVNSEQHQFETSSYNFVHHEGGGQPYENKPLYYALAFIMKL